MKIILTGAAGFIGSCYLRKLNGEMVPVLKGTLYVQNFLPVGFSF